MRSTYVGSQMTVGQVDFGRYIFPKRLVKNVEWLAARAATLGFELSNLARQRREGLIGLVLVATSAACAPQSSLLGSLTTIGGGAAGASGQWNSAAGSAGAPAVSPVAKGGSGVALDAFGTPRAIPALATAGMVTTDPTVTGDGLEMYMMSTRSGSKDLWVSKRANVSVEWPEPTPVTELNMAGVVVESNCRVSPDGLSLWFFSDRDRVKGTLWEAQRATTWAVWADPTVIPGLCATGASDISVALDEPRLIAVFSSLRSGTEKYDLFEARRGSSSVTFEAPALIAVLNSEEDDYDPYLSSDGLLLLFHSNRLGNDDIFWARRFNLDSAFSAPLPLAEVNSAAADMAPSMAADQSAIWFASTRDGDEQIYVATVARK